MRNQGLKGFVALRSGAFCAADMKAVEMNCAALGIGAAELMENAAHAVSDFISKSIEPGSNILVFAGRGNNGGDGATSARHLMRDYNVTVAFLNGVKDMREGPARANAEIMASSRFANVLENVSEMDYKELSALMTGNDVIIDAIFGTGFSGSMPRWAGRVIEGINRYRKGHSVTVISVDLPSGMDADLGPGKDMVDADYTLTFHRTKKGLLGTKNKVRICSIGIPPDAELFCGPGDAWKAVQPRRLESSKRDNGTVLLIGGSSAYHGAPSSAAAAAYETLAALRTGAGYAKLYVPESIKLLAMQASPNIIVGSMGRDFIDYDSAGNAVKDLERADAIVLGMGIGRNEKTIDAVRRLVSMAGRLGKKTVLDADALYAIKGMRMPGHGFVLTPHAGEMLALSGKDLKDAPLEEKIRQVIGAAKKLNATIVLKGHESVISDGKALRVNRAGSSALATMGTGDILSGIIGGYAATGAGVFDAAVAGVYLHSRIGDTLAVKRGNHILAIDILERIPDVAREFDKNI